MVKVFKASRLQCPPTCAIRTHVTTNSEAQYKCYIRTGRNILAINSLVDVKQCSTNKLWEAHGSGRALKRKKKWGTQQMAELVMLGGCVLKVINTNNWGLLVGLRSLMDRVYVQA